jgi:putative transcription factor
MNHPIEADFEVLTLRKSNKQLKQIGKNNPNVEQITVQKHDSGKNHQHEPIVDSRKADDQDYVPPPKIELSLGKTIAKFRTQLKMTQKDLAQKINEKPAVINSYENGTAIPSSQILAKIEQHLHVKLRGKNIGSPL